MKQEFAQMITDRKSDVSEAQNVERKWKSRKMVSLEAAEDLCGWTERLLTHHEKLMMKRIMHEIKRSLRGNVRLLGILNSLRMMNNNTAALSTGIKAEMTILVYHD